MEVPITSYSKLNGLLFKRLQFYPIQVIGYLINRKLAPLNQLHFFSSAVQDVTIGVRAAS